MQNTTFYGFTPVPRDPDIVQRSYDGQQSSSQTTYPSFRKFCAAVLPDMEIFVKDHHFTRFTPYTLNHKPNGLWCGPAGRRGSREDFPSVSFDPETFYVALQNILSITKQSFAVF